MRIVRRLSPTIKAVIRTRQTRTLGTEIEIAFKRRVWWLVWSYIYPHRYLIRVRDFWDPCGMHDRGGIMEGKPLRDSNSWYQFETWKPEFFDLDRRLQDAYLQICEEDARNSEIYTQVKSSIKP